MTADLKAQLVAQYKQILAEMLSNRPSGTRQRLATMLRKNRSFISQISNPSYATPIPARHLEIIFEVCHFSEKDRRDFLTYYDQAHPSRRQGSNCQHHEAHREGMRFRRMTVYLPDLGSDDVNKELDGLILEIARRLSHLLQISERS
ncbi:MAG: hypothetical protein CMN54_04045 [SAR324 cluster bacterium]|uniref:Uncharacterized protein n=1 Tax=SAR324 cluster bacterium TaxID=2024889 RepID=A0A2D6YHF6_9DELT|nr:hypothetical protein [SAR324 cluster bacterium]